MNETKEGRKRSIWTLNRWLTVVLLLGGIPTAITALGLSGHWLYNWVSTPSDLAAFRLEYQNDHHQLETNLVSFMQKIDSTMASKADIAEARQARHDEEDIRKSGDDYLQSQLFVIRTEMRTNFASQAESLDDIKRQLAKKPLNSHPD